MKIKGRTAALALFLAASATHAELRNRKDRSLEEVTADDGETTQSDLEATFADQIEPIFNYGQEYLLGPNKRGQKRKRKGSGSSNCVDPKKVPLDVHRRAAQLMEDVRGTASAPTWDDATFARTCVRVLNRPDIKGPAFYEFRVRVDGKPAGFIVASTGNLDLPFPHWDFNGESPTEMLIKQGASADDTFFKLDTSSYVAENEDGELSAMFGGVPLRITGQQKVDDEAVNDTTVEWIPDITGKDDDEARHEKAERVVDGTEKGSFGLEDWDSWKDLKAEYSVVYSKLISSLKKEAADDWEVEREAIKDGEGLVKHETFELALLFVGAKFKLSGKGEKMVSVKKVRSAPRREILAVTVHTVHKGEELPLEVNIVYPNKIREVVRFTVIDEEDVDTKLKDDWNVHWVKDGLDLQGSWSQWYEFWAGNSLSQRLYRQIRPRTGPNNKGCYSGCGATAWAMLFGWADYQAGNGNAAWKHRWGIYRQNGGKGADDVAPRYMDNGVNLMTWEIRNHIDTWCWTTSGATFPWDMNEASEYLKGRSGCRLSTSYNVLGIHTSGLREKARDSIINRKTPAIIGTGWLKHYPLAYGYRWRKRRVKKCFIFCWHETEYQRQFYVNQGWGGSGNGWVNAGTWFVGSLYPN